MPTVYANVIQDAFSPLISVFQSILVFLHQHIFGGSWGLAIIGLTVVVRAVLVPLTLSQFRSMAKMQQVAPQLQQLKEKYKDDKQRQSQEMMKIYRENGVNPFASCLPLLLQLPVFISLFYMLRTKLKADICGNQLAHYFHVASKSALTNTQLGKLSCHQVPGAAHSAKFLFIPDITSKTTGVVLVVLLLLYVATQLASTLMMSVTVDQTQRRLMLALPLFFTLFIFTFPGGLLVYWITTNLWTMGQQYIVRRVMGPPPAPPPKAARGRPGARQPSANGVPATEPALAGAASGGGSASARGAGNGAGSSSGRGPAAGRAGGPPPPPPRRKKKRSGRRR